jgi:putative copper export protein
MMPNPLTPALVTFLHDLFTAIWIGGMISLGLVTLPAIRAQLGQGPETQRLVQAIFRRLSVLAKVSIVGLIVTGLLLSRRATLWQGLFSTGNVYSLVLTIKHVVVIMMVGIAAVRASVLSANRPLKPSRNRLLAALLLANIVLGIVVLALSAYGAVINNVCVVPR